MSWQDIGCTEKQLSNIRNLLGLLISNKIEFETFVLKITLPLINHTERSPLRIVAALGSLFCGNANLSSPRREKWSLQVLSLSSPSPLPSLYFVWVWGLFFFGYRRNFRHFILPNLTNYLSMRYVPLSCHMSLKYDRSCNERNTDSSVYW